MDREFRGFAATCVPFCPVPLDKSNSQVGTRPIVISVLPRDRFPSGPIGDKSRSDFLSFDERYLSVWPWILWEHGSGGNLVGRGTEETWQVYSSCRINSEVESSPSGNPFSFETSPAAAECPAYTIDTHVRKVTFSFGSGSTLGSLAERPKGAAERWIS